MEARKYIVNSIMRGFIAAACLVFCVVSSGFGQTEWTEYGGNPVLDLGAPGSWDAGVVFLPCVITKSDTLMMWYAGDSVSQIFSTHLNIGHAWSMDGINWTRYGGNPVITNASEPVVIRDGDTLRMWYDLGYATSVDGVNWDEFTVSGLGPGPAGEWNADLFFPGGVIKEGGTYKMLFGGGTGSFPNNDWISTGLATSTDAVNWVFYDDPATADPPYQYSDPVLVHGGTGAWDQRRAWTARWRATASGYEMWFAGKNNAGDQDIGYASSADGIHWTKYSGNPVLQTPGTWANEFSSPCVILDSAQSLYRMWMSGFQPAYPYEGRIGYATADVPNVDEDAAVNAGLAAVNHVPTVFRGSLKYLSDMKNCKVFNIIGSQVNPTYLSPGIYFVEIDGKINGKVIKVR